MQSKSTIENIGLTRLNIFFIVVAILLAIPLIAMQFSKEINWSGFDFLISGILLTGTALLIELILRKCRTVKSRIILCGIVFIILLLTWIELAVGIFGTPFTGS